MIRGSGASQSSPAVTPPRSRRQAHYAANPQPDDKKGFEGNSGWAGARRALNTPHSTPYHEAKTSQTEARASRGAAAGPVLVPLLAARTHTSPAAPSGR
jgi:hypothetical protein